MNNQWHEIPEPGFSSEEGIFIKDFFLPENLNWFDGHFPEKKILPGIAQITMVFDVISKYKKNKDKKIKLKEIKRIRFSKPIFPHTNVDIFAMEDKNKPCTYLFKVNAQGESASSGVLIIEELD